MILNLLFEVNLLRIQSINQSFICKGQICSSRPNISQKRELTKILKYLKLQNPAINCNRLKI